MNFLPRLVDAFFFCSLGEAAAAAALVMAVSLCLGFAPAGRVIGLVFAGTLAVYNLDRLRDLERDRVHSPERSRFVSRHRRPLIAATAVGALAAAGWGVLSGADVAVLALGLLFLGVAHRRLKRFSVAKPAYLASAWTVMVVGFPVIDAPYPVTAGDAAWAVLLVGTALLANATAAGIGHEASTLGARAAGETAAPRALLQARLLALVAVLASLLAPPGLRSLGVVPLLVFCALLVFRADERFRLVMLDGALLAGALAASSLAMGNPFPDFRGFIYG